MLKKEQKRKPKTTTTKNNIYVVLPGIPFQAYNP